MKNILLHACCAPCSAYCMQKLTELGFEPVIYFYNPNIFPENEFNKRLEELKDYCNKMQYELLVEQQDSNIWYDYISGLEEEEEKGLRCDRCFELRLTMSAIKALKLDIPVFTTTLTISPHKNSKKIIEIGTSLAKKYELNFLDIDFKKQDGFVKTMQIAKGENFYRQNYCGCEFSIK